MPQTLTPAQARACLIRQGKTVAAFAREHGLDRNIVYQVLDGRKKGRYGESHRAAVLLGIKVGDFPPALRPANQHSTSQHPQSGEQ